MTTFPKARMIATNGIELEVYEAGPADGVPIVLCHGFPELAYSWRHQIPVLAEAGYRVIAPNQRGYGRSSKPDAIVEYDIHHLTADLTGLLDHYGIERAIFCGHDWGGLVVWQVPLLHPERVAGIIGVGVPFLPRGSSDPIELFRKAFGDRMYIVNFQDSHEADEVFDSDPWRVFDVLMRGNPVTLDRFLKLPPKDRVPDLVARIKAGPWDTPRIIGDEEIKVFADTFRHGGFTGPINWYRNWSRNWATTADRPQRVDVPCLFVRAGNDLATASIPDLEKGMAACVADLECREIRESGHWTQQEFPDELNEILLDWLRRRFPV
ncbi:MAG: alpha/beta fold hydrolase [Sphingomonadales bacterium]